MQVLKRYLADQSAATAIEYALIAVLVSTALIGSIRLVSNSVTNTWNTVSTTVDEQLSK
ncbi:Flp family type IVb pilin [Rhizobium halophytocola]|uniref:Pilus assembly protein Flp/PilA n=1 Tax=Rhizobium halophytocola TaxID=735519 RepID=A0ABS4E2B0_9HYPH|nr:Flp family type IVb pilin [Rhizobium halophytocola]MBP1852068.1 pilus assembly protein Flp/PilA [Rhizobium halophytocola]